jgi:predicted GNAT family acetyltransferase
LGGDPRHGTDPAIPVVEVIHRPDDRFYELLVDGRFGGLAVYETADNRYVFTHTFIAEGYRGRGMSQVLLRGVLEDIQTRHLTMTNYCPVLERFIAKNPEYAALIDSGQPGTWPRASPGSAASSAAGAPA